MRFKPGSNRRYRPLHSWLDGVIACGTVLVWSVMHPCLRRVCSSASYCVSTLTGRALQQVTLYRSSFVQKSVRTILFFIRPRCTCPSRPTRVPAWCYRLRSGARVSKRSYGSRPQRVTHRCTIPLCRLAHILLHTCHALGEHIAQFCACRQHTALHFQMCQNKTPRSSFTARDRRSCHGTQHPGPGGCFGLWPPTMPRPKRTTACATPQHIARTLRTLSLIHLVRWNAGRHTAVRQPLVPTSVTHPNMPTGGARNIAGIRVHLLPRVFSDR